MLAAIYGVVAWAMGGLLQTLLVGAGLSLVVFATISPMVEALLNQAVGSLSGMPSIAVQFILLAGVGEAVSILGSAILTRVAINSVSKIAGLKIAGS